MSDTKNGKPAPGVGHNSDGAEPKQPRLQPPLDIPYHHVKSDDTIGQLFDRVVVASMWQGKDTRCTHFAYHLHKHMNWKTGEFREPLARRQTERTLAKITGMPKTHVHEVLKLYVAAGILKRTYIRSGTAGKLVLDIEGIRRIQALQEAARKAVDDRPEDTSKRSNTDRSDTDRMSEERSNADQHWSDTDQDRSNADQKRSETTPPVADTALASLDLQELQRRQAHGEGTRGWEKAQEDLAEAIRLYTKAESTEDLPSALAKELQGGATHAHVATACRDILKLVKKGELERHPLDALPGFVRQAVKRGAERRPPSSASPPHGKFGTYADYSSESELRAALEADPQKSRLLGRSWPLHLAEWKKALNQGGAA